MAASNDTISKYLSRLLPKFKVSPVPEVIFLPTIRALVVPAANLSLFQWGIVGSLILLTNVSPTLRKATVKLYGYLSFVIATEIALINAYVLVCSWISPSTTLQPLTVVILNVLHSIVPVYTDSLVLYLLVKEKLSHSDSKIELVSSMGTPILLKVVRLANAVMYIHTSAEFILTSFTVTKGGVNPDTTIMDIARTRDVHISTSLQLVDNLYSLYVHWLHMTKMWKFIGSAPPLNPTSIVALVWPFSLNYILLIVLSVAQLAISSYLQSSKIAMLIDSAKVVINIASALRVMMSSTKHLIDLPASSALLKKAEDVARDMLKVIPVPPPVAFADDSIETTVSQARKNEDLRPPGRSRPRGYPEDVSRGLSTHSSPLGSTVLNDPAVDRQI